MRALERNKRSLYYALYDDKVPLEDEWGNETGEYQVIYTDPIPFKANISAAQGERATRQFGDTENYDKVIVIDDPDFPIDEQSILWVDVIPVWSDATEEWSPHNAVVRKVARSLNSVSYAIRMVNVSA